MSRTFLFFSTFTRSPMRSGPSSPSFQGGRASVLLKIASRPQAWLLHIPQSGFTYPTCNRHGTGWAFSQCTF